MANTSFKTSLKDNWRYIVLNLLLTVALLGFFNKGWLLPRIFHPFHMSRLSTGLLISILTLGLIIASLVLMAHLKKPKQRFWAIPIWLVVLGGVIFGLHFTELRTSVKKGTANNGSNDKPLTPAQLDSTHWAEFSADSLAGKEISAERINDWVIHYQRPYPPLVEDENTATQPDTPQPTATEEKVVDTTDRSAQRKKELTEDVAKIKQAIADEKALAAKEAKQKKEDEDDIAKLSKELQSLKADLAEIKKLRQQTTSTDVAVTGTDQDDGADKVPPKKPGKTPGKKGKKVGGGTNAKTPTKSSEWVTFSEEKTN